jgi:FkbM family methyltransferase
MMRLAHRLYRKLFARPLFRRFNSSLLYFSLHGLGVLNFENDQVSGERHLIQSWLKRKLTKEKLVFFDVGANIGEYSGMLVDNFPTAMVHAFEPHPRNYMALSTRAFLNGRVKCHNLALGESQGSLTLYDRADYSGSTHASLHRAVISEIHQQQVVEFTVSVETLDAVADMEHVTYVDYLKIDTEGHELAVLAGASRLLREGKIGIIQFEFNEMNVVSRVFFRDFRKILCNYDLYRLLPTGMILLGTNPLVTELFAYQNIVAVPKAANGASALSVS